MPVSLVCASIHLDLRGAIVARTTYQYHEKAYGPASAEVYASLCRDDPPPPQSRRQQNKRRRVDVQDASTSSPAATAAAAERLSRRVNIFAVNPRDDDDDDDLGGGTMHQDESLDCAPSAAAASPATAPSLVDILKRAPKPLVTQPMRQPYKKAYVGQYKHVIDYVSV